MAKIGQGSMMLWKNFFPLPVRPLGSSQVFPDGYAGKGPPSESFSSLDAQQQGILPIAILMEMW